MKRGNYNVFKFMGNDFRSDFKNNSSNSWGIFVIAKSEKLKNKLQYEKG